MIMVVNGDGGKVVSTVIVIKSINVTHRATDDESFN